MGFLVGLSWLPAAYYRGKGKGYKHAADHIHSNLDKELSECFDRIIATRNSMNMTGPFTVNLIRRVDEDTGETKH